MEKNKKIKHKPPSRIRYEKSHPTISFRLGIELKTRLKEILEKESFASFIKEALGERERVKKSLEEARNVGYGEGYQKGYEEAKKEFGVYGECSVCGGAMVVDREEDKKEIASFLSSTGWSHAKCAELQREYRHKYRV